MKRIKIAVNTRLLLKGKLEGIGWFTFESMKRICLQHPEVDFFFIFDRRPDPGFIFSPNIKPLVVAPQARHPLLFYIWFNITVPAKLNALKPDLFLSPDGYNVLPFRGKSLLVIHDLNFEHYPKDLPWLVRKYYRYFFPRFARKATRIATVSEFSKQDIKNQYGIDPNRIDVVYDGVNELYKPVNEETKVDTKVKFTGGYPYFIFIGSLHPRKNLVNLFKAFDIYKKTDNQGAKLVIAGAKKYWTKDIENTFQRLKHSQDVIFTDRLNENEVNDLLGSALGLLYVSYFEGFGIPILEAFACHTPVITSNRSSMPEIAGDAALLVDPFSPADIANAMTRIAQTEMLRKELVDKGVQRLREFSWNRTADLLWESVNKTLSND
ncbi:MAG: glycosyltransferase family 4 protein [Bacteroidales bacterium]